MTRVLFPLMLVLAAIASPAAAAPCVTEAECVEWLPLGNGGGRVLVYRSLPLDGSARAVTRAVIVIHGGSAGAGGHFTAGIEAARLAGALDDTLVIAPRIPSNDNYVCNDRLDEREINWGCQANNGWPAGGTATGDDALTSYDITDEILRRLARKATFPNLQSVVIVGHSAGGQYVTRYAMANQVHERLGGVRVSYVVANPAHYAYPDAGRLDGDGRELPADLSRSGCKIYDDWPYGIQDRRGYAARVPDAELRAHLASRPVTYLLGELDTLTSGGLDTTCAAMAQGPNRLRRGQTFAAYVGAKYNASQSVVVVPGCGHNTRCMLTAPAALPVLFPKAARASGR